MMLRKIPCLLVSILLSVFYSNAQTPNDYAKNWKTVEQLEAKGLTASALKEVIQIFNLAIAANNEAQQIKSAMYQIKYRNMTEEDSYVKNIFFIDTLVNKTKAPVKNILQSMQAELFLNYRAMNRHKFYNRTDLAEEKSNDINTWGITKLNETIAGLYKASLSNEAILKSTKLNGLDAILIKGKNSRNLRPTLFDFLAHRALSYFMLDENTAIQPAYKFVINDERIFAPANEFINVKFATKDSSALEFNAIMLLQDLLRFHMNDSDPAALIDVDLIRLKFGYDKGVFTNKEKLYEASLLNIERKYRSNPASAQAAYLRAELHAERGAKYHPFTNKDVQFEIRRAIDVADSAIVLFPNTEGGINAKNLKIRLQVPTLQVETEKVNLPGQPFRSLVTYKNIDALHFRIIKVSRDEIKKFNTVSYEARWKSILGLAVTKKWSVTLPNLKDHQQHATEIKIDALEPGSYYLLSSLNADFSLNNNIIGRSVIHVSDISYIHNNKQELFVLHRDNGMPLKGAEVQLWSSEYNYTTRTYVEIKKERFTTDANGFVKLIQEKTKNQQYNKFIQIRHNNQELFTDDTYYTYDYYNDRERPTKSRTFLFTDRAIYRPGQTIFFKGIVVKTDSLVKNTRAFEGYKTTLIMTDANGQKAGSLQLVANEFGSYSGTFKLPEGLLNGNFYLRDSVNNSTVNFKVEEYKRPKFFVEIAKPSGTYRLNDSITVTGNAAAYAGNSLDGADVSYRVVRKVRYPIWWGFYRSWPPYDRGQEMEITNGTTATDNKGNFIIKFKAIPDETAEKKNQPIFYYEVMADVTDINGETRSHTTSVSVSYQALQLAIEIPEKVIADSLKTIKIKSTNLNGVHEKSSVELSVYKLIQPSRIYRARYWDVPDQFVMTKEEFIKNFPHDAYKDEDQVSSWALGERIIQRTDTTNGEGYWQLNIKPEPGWYKIVVKTKDKYGEEVMAEKFVEVTGDKTSQPIAISVRDKNAEPGQKVNYTIATGFQDIWLIQSILRTDKSIGRTYHTVRPARSYENEVNVTENDRGGINIGYAFVKHNRVYQGNEGISVPWNNKQLAISFETFRDKLLPGAEEKWKIRLTGNMKEKVAAEMLISMYDASLDQFQKHNWPLLTSLWPVNVEALQWNIQTFQQIHAELHYTLKIPSVPDYEKDYDQLLQNGWSNGYRDVNVRIRGIASASPSVAREELAMSEVMVTQSGASKMEGDAVMDMRAKKAADTAVIEDKSTLDNGSIQIRKNFNETAFFFPSLVTDANGNIEFSFTIPEALTQWKLMSMSHTKDLQSTYAEKLVVTQKTLMVQPNVPRFLREGDQVELPIKIVNMGKDELTGTVTLELFDAATNKPLDGWFKNVFPMQHFTASAGETFLAKFPVTIPFSFNSVLSYRIKAATKANAEGTTYSDGEEAALPILTNRMLVTETFPINMRKVNSKTFSFDKLLASNNSGTLTNHALTVEYTSNPAWYAVQALPFLAESPVESADNQFNRYYANTLAGFIANVSPRIKGIVEKWKNLDTAALLSNLQKNEELKSLLLQETPWVLSAQNETQQKKNIALLFDMVRMAAAKESALNKLKAMQAGNGGFVWFVGGPDDRYITQYILTGIGHMKKLNALQSDDLEKLKSIIGKGLPYLDARLKEEYDYLIRQKVKLANNNLSFNAIQYLYMRSFFKEEKIAANAQAAVAYYKEQARKYWLSKSKYMQGMIALALHRTGDQTIPKAILRSLKENAINHEELGMYWKENTTGGYFWHQAPIESQALLIEAFSDIEKDQAVIDDLKTWLLKQKQTRNWRSTRATADACYALLLQGNDWLNDEKKVTIQLGNTTVMSTDEAEAGTGYFKKTIAGEKVQQGMGNIHVSVKPSTSTSATSTSWGAVYWQYFEELDKITSAETPLKLSKQVFIHQNTAKGPVLTLLKDGDALQIGDKVKIRIELRADRDMEYLHMKDMRAAAMEPVNVLSQYKYQGGLGYYESTKDASTNFFFSWLPRGTYVFEYPMFVAHSGNFSNGITTIQSLYAPEFSSHSNGIRISVDEKK